MDKSTLPSTQSPRLVFRPTAAGVRVTVDPTSISAISSDGSVIGNGLPAQLVDEDATAPGGAGTAYKVTCPATGGDGTSATLHWSMDVDPGTGVVTIEGDVEIDFIHPLADNAGLSVEGVAR